MKLIFLFLLVLSFYTAASYSSIYKSIKDDVLSYLARSHDFKKPRFEIESNNDNKEKPSKVTNIFEKAMLLKAKSKKEYELRQQSKKILEAREQSVREPSIKRQYIARIDDTKNMDREHFQLDPILNFLKRRTDFRRKHHDTEEEEDTSSSSVEMQEWKDQWKEHWIKKKFEALNSTEPRGDVVNMVAARPWGVPCGDPNQHDMPWGTCMLPMECDSEYRIYRGDYFCGRTQFVCCSIQYTNYDMYQGFDVSFADSALTTDSEEKRNRGKGSKEKRRRKKRRERRRRKRERARRKRKIKKNIMKIVREIKKILNRVYRNGTSSRKKKTKQLKLFIKELKKRYKKDRQSVKDIHEVELIKIDANLQRKLDQIKSVNQNFMKNSTFREIIVNGTTDKKGARMLVEAYPDLLPYLGDKTRRAGGEKDHLDYDIEYGMLYF